MGRNEFLNRLKKNKRLQKRKIKLIKLYRNNKTRLTKYPAQ